MQSTQLRGSAHAPLELMGSRVELSHLWRNPTSPIPGPAKDRVCEPCKQEDLVCPGSLSSGSAIVYICLVLLNAGLATYLLFSSSVPSGQQSYHGYGYRLCQRPSEGGLSQNPTGLPCCHCIVSPRKWKEPWFQGQTDMSCLGPVTLQLCVLGQAA